MNGIVVLDKPSGISSAAAVDRVKRALGAKRAGHGGTLDPLATGVLVICLGEATKIASYLLADDKSYIADLVLGIETDTLDRTGSIVATRDASGVTPAMLETVLATRRGEQDQIPPMFSAIKQHGVRLYRHARSGVEVERMPRRIRIDQLELIAFEPPRATLAISCSKGTYIRSLVADIGGDLGCGGHLVELRRTRSGVFSIDQALRLEELEPTAGVHSSLVPRRSPDEGVRKRLLAMEVALTLPIVTIPPGLVARVRSGVQLATTQFPNFDAAFDRSPEVPDADQGRGLPSGAEGDRDESDSSQLRFQLRDESDRLVAIAHVEQGRMVYDRVFRFDGEATD